MTPEEGFPHASINRRRVLTAAMISALTLGAVRRLTFAQSATPAAGTALPAHAVAWPRFNLNSASVDQLMGVPGAGEKMTHEFEEYRPYTSIGQFRGEIGKYLPPNDVAALEKYLFVPVDPNTADADTLQQLPGVSTDTAQQLIAGRPYADSAAFQSALAGTAGAELAGAAVSFLEPDAGPVASWLRYDLNTATTGQLSAIPGAGDKMTHEFEEYRPYTSIGQFRGEIGKYLPPEDVATLEKYLFVPVDPNTADEDTMLQLPGLTPELVASLVAQRPFSTLEAFTQALQGHVSPDLITAIGPYLTHS